MKDRRRQTVRLVENIPFFSIFIMMAGGIVTPLLGGRNRARVLHLVLAGAVAVMSGLLLGYTYVSYTHLDVYKRQQWYCK